MARFKIHSKTFFICTLVGVTPLLAEEAVGFVSDVSLGKERGTIGREEADVIFGDVLTLFSSF